MGGSCEGLPSFADQDQPGVESSLEGLSKLGIYLKMALRAAGRSPKSPSEGLREL